MNAITPTDKLDFFYTNNYRKNQSVEDEDFVIKNYLSMFDPNKPLNRGAIIQEIVHELRNPLTAIKIANDLLRQEQEEGSGDSDEARTFTEIIGNNITRLDNLIKTLLNERNRADASKSPIGVSQLIDAVLEEVKDRIFLKNVEIKKTYSPGCFVLGDKSRLASVFLNIIVNAIEAIQVGKGKIWLTVYPTNGKKIHVVIKDNGRGIASEMLEKIFDANFTQKPGGVGVGLSHVKEILDAHQAIITVDSQENIGTSFLIQFDAVDYLP